MLQTIYSMVHECVSYGRISVRAVPPPPSRFLWLPGRCLPPSCIAPRGKEQKVHESRWIEEETVGQTVGETVGQTVGETVGETVRETVGETVWVRIRETVGVCVTRAMDGYLECLACCMPATPVRATGTACRRWGCSPLCYCPYCLYCLTESRPARPARGTVAPVGGVKRGEWVSARHDNRGPRSHQYLPLIEVFLSLHPQGMNVEQ